MPGSVGFTGEWTAISQRIRKMSVHEALEEQGGLMGRVKALKRKGRELALKEKRLKEQHPPTDIQQVQREARQQAELRYRAGYNDGYLQASEEALAEAKETKTIATVRRRLGAQARTARINSGIKDGS